MMLSALVVIAIAATTGLMIWYSRASAFEEHQRAMNSMGVVLAEQTSRSVQVIDLILEEVQSHIVNLQIANSQDFRKQLETAEFQAYLVKHLTNVPQVNAVAVIDADGFIVSSSRNRPASHGLVSDHDEYQYLKNHDDPSLFYRGEC